MSKKGKCIQTLQVSPCQETLTHHKKWLSPMRAIYRRLEQDGGKEMPQLAAEHHRPRWFET
eukprot:543723-Amphidinium_carterae.1